MSLTNGNEITISLAKMIPHDTVGPFFDNFIKTKIISALELAFSASVYKAKDAIYNLGQSQYVLLLVFYAFTSQDECFITILLDAVSMIKSHKYSYLKIWIKEDFTFTSGLIYKALSYIFLKKDTLKIPQGVIEIFLTLEDKYRIDTECDINKNKNLLTWVIESKFREEIYI